MNNYAFRSIALNFKYVNEIKIDIAIPLIDETSGRNLSERTIKLKNIKIIKNNIPKINNEFLIRIKAYTGTIFSFQWSLIFDEMIIPITLFEFLPIKLI